MAYREATNKEQEAKASEGVGAISKSYAQAAKKREVGSLGDHSCKRQGASAKETEMQGYQPSHSQFEQQRKGQATQGFDMDGLWKFDK